MILSRLGMNKTQRTYISTVNIHLIMKQVTLFGKLVPSQKQPWFKSEDNNYMRFVNIEWMRSKGESKKEFETNVKKNWNENFKKDL